MNEVGRISIEANTFIIEIEEPDALGLQECIYAFVIQDEIVRVGSSKAPFKSRLRSWQRHVSLALCGQVSKTPFAQAQAFRDLLRETQGIVFARNRTVVDTPIGEISAYLAEEKVLIERHKPRFSKR